MEHTLMIIGFGTVGQALAKLLHQQREELLERYDFQFRLIGVADMKFGSIASSTGLEPEALLAALDNTRRIGTIKGQDHVTGLSAFEMIETYKPDIVIELTPTDLSTGQPAIDHIRTALENGCHAVTANKGPAALAYHELNSLARNHKVAFRFEPAVLSGTPVFSLVRSSLMGAGIQEVRGILNGTSNYILEMMSKGQSFDAVLADAQAKGYAEADPTADIDGLDAKAKVLILANALFDVQLAPERVACTGIRGITQDDIADATAKRQYIKLIGRVWVEDDAVHASVGPERLSPEDPLAHVNGVTNAIVFSTTMLGELTVIGPGAGGIPTAYGILADILAIHSTGVRG